ncbi:hypothetical protein F5B20DRAFT_542924 [Whalleya microplaca]|nr:hypothetical protein F5B20DRAFT_542924 [Whalleya microplaca]
MASDPTFCPLCSVLVDQWQGDASELTDPENRFSWLTEVRAIRTSLALERPFVTGVGWLNFVHEVIASAEYSCHYTDRDPQQQLEEYFAVHKLGYWSDDTLGYCCFVVHDACWELLRDRIDPSRRLPVNTLAKHLFTLLYNTPINSAYSMADRGSAFNLKPQHDFGHAAQFQRMTAYGYHTRVTGSAYSWITGNPSEEFQPEDETLEDAMPALNAPFTLPEMALGIYSDSDPFYLLPSELIALILAVLPSSDLCNLRLASRYVADESKPRLLPPRFWSSRFDADQEMGFVFANSLVPGPTEPADWRMLYLKAKAAIRADCFPGFRNRRRIWQILPNISDALRLRLQNEEWMSSGESDSSPLISTVACAEASFVPGDSQEDRNLSRKPLELSCRLFKQQSISWPLNRDAKPTILRVSSIYVNGRTYISGLRIIPPEGSEGVDESPRAGYINISNEHELVIGSDDYIELLEVAMTTSGLTGFRLHMTDSQSSRYSVSTGDMKLTDSASGIARLTPRIHTRCIGFHIGLDACKVISITLLERQMETRSPVITDDTNSTYFLGPKLAELWNPNCPSAYPVWHSLPSSPVYFNQCLDMDFGGPDGRLLRSLVRVVAFMGPYPYVFVGMSFLYDDGSERFYGRRTFSTARAENLRAIQQSFPVDGPAGELMTSVQISYSEKWYTVQAIKITTNLGRTKNFCLYGTRHFGDKEVQISMEAEPGTLLTAFCAKVTRINSSLSGSFGDLCICSELPNDSLPIEASVEPSDDMHHHIPLNSETLISAEEMLSYPGGFAFNAADLSRLKRIRVSVDEEGYPHSRGHISGLRLEYHDCKAPVILGQWHKELDAVDLGPDDRITEMTTWHDVTNNYKRVKFGLIKKLKLRTASGINKDFLDPFVGGKVCLHYRENPYEELTGILWGYNHEWDHVRVFCTPKPNSRGTPLIINSANHPSFSWMVREKVFLQETHSDGSPDPATAIEVTYRELGSEPSGITLIYEHGEPRTLGSRGIKPQTMNLAPGEMLATLEIGISRGNYIEMISFSTTSGRKFDFSENQDVDIVNEFIRTRTMYVLHPSYKVELTDARHLYKHPDGAGVLVGFWAMPKRHNRSLRYPMLGPIFEKADGGGVQHIEEVLRRI